MGKFVHAARLSVLATVFVTVVGCGDADVQSSLRRARELSEKRDYAAAVVQLKGALASDPASGEARQLLGEILMKQADPAKALLELRKARELKQPDVDMVPLIAEAMLALGQERALLDEFGPVTLPGAAGNAALRTTLATAQARLGQTAQSEKSLAAAIVSVPGYPAAMLMQARLKVFAGNLAEAREIVDKVVAANPGDANAWVLLGDVQLAVDGNIDTAINTYRKAVAADSRSVTAQSVLIKALLRKGELSVAQQQWEILKQIWPNHPSTLYFEAEIAFRKNDFARSRDLLQRVLAGGSPNYDSLLLAGIVEERLNSLNRAEKLLSAAVSANPAADAPRQVLAKIYLRLGQPSKAIETLKPVLENKSADGASLTIAAEAYLLAGEFDKAESLFTRAGPDRLNDPEVRTARALVQLAKGNSAAAMAQLAAVSASDKDIIADLALVSINMRRGDLDAALRSVDKLLVKRPDRAVGHELKGRVLRMKRDTVGARSSFEAALKADPKYLFAVNGLAGLDLEAGNPASARKRYESVLAEDPKNYAALMALADLGTRLGDSPETIRKWLQSAREAAPHEPGPRLRLSESYLAARDFKRALELSQETVAAFGANAEAQAMLGKALVSSGDTRQAIAAFTKVAALQPRSPRPLADIGEVQLAARDFDGAASSFGRALQLDPRFGPAQQGLIKTALVGKDARRAQSVALALQRAKPADSAGFELAGDIEAAQKNWAGAVTAFRAGLGKTGSISIPAKLHYTLVAAGRTDEAQKFSRDWQAQHPRDATFLYYLGDDALTRKDFAAGERFYRSVIAIQPKNVWALNNLAWVLASAKKPEGEQLAKRAVELAPESAVLIDTWAYTLAQTGQLARALEVEKTAVLRSPMNGKFRLNLASYYLQAGDKVGAKTEFEAAIKAEPALTTRQDVSALKRELGL